MSAAAKRGKWYTAAAATIARTVHSLPPGSTWDETIRAVDAAYPFGERAYFPYKEWLRARRDFAATRGMTPMVACPACGAREGRPCQQIADEQVPHDSRRVTP